MDSFSLKEARNVAQNAANKVSDIFSNCSGSVPRFDDTADAQGENSLDEEFIEAIASGKHLQTENWFARSRF